MIVYIFSFMIVIYANVNYLMFLYTMIQFRLDETSAAEFQIRTKRSLVSLFTYAVLYMVYVV